MNIVTLSGASDDLIELTGDMRDEFTADENGNVVAFSEGTLARIEYGSGGLWKISVISQGDAEIERFEATDPDGDEYSDKLTLKGDVEWAVCGKLAARQKKP